MQLIQYGLGPVGCAIARVVLRRGYKFLAAVDSDPHKAGRDLGEVIGWEEKLGVPVYGSFQEVLPAGGGAVVTHATGSFLPAVAPQLLELLEVGCTVISTCEELSYPYLRYPQEAAALAEAARRGGGKVLGTGVNPGFIMDFLPLVLTLCAQEVSALEVRRKVDVASRRGPLQVKVGVGLTPEQFEQGRREGKIGHVGLPESVAMLAAGLGWSLAKIEESVTPVIADRPIVGGVVEVLPGRVAGLHQVATGYREDGEAAIRLDLTMTLGGESLDRITINGTPPLTFEVAGGVHGDLATAAVVVNCIPALAELPPGLYTMLDLNRAHYRAV
ncbi:hypothetical protein [Desulfovirgula thermocuniculi]|uniref:NAD(P)H-dependent amine dehydrogenase family protein n=1 Tax=Desulfovirgula thermocuniculi TaxID=348842 RepID=UPI0003FC9098|nr:hypothetical protein [Desulfovirgula thermocuniculi]